MNTSFKIFYLLIFSLFFISSLQAQKLEDVITMKDGQVIKGTIVEQADSSIIKVNLIGGSTLILNIDDVQKTALSIARYNKVRLTLNHDRLPILVHDKGLYNYFDVGFTFQDGRNNNSRVDPGFNYGIGYRINQNLGIGFATGIQVYNSGVILPFMAEVTGDLSRNRITPFYSLKGGYGIGIANFWSVNSFEGGPVAQAMIGVKRRTLEKVEWRLAAGFKAQWAKDIIEQWFWGPNGEGSVSMLESDRLFRGVIIQAGIGF